MFMILPPLFTVIGYFYNNIIIGAYVGLSLEIALYRSLSVGFYNPFYFPINTIFWFANFIIWCVDVYTYKNQAVYLVYRQVFILAYTMV